MHSWKVTLQSADGQVVEREVKAHWNPEHTGTQSAVLGAAKAEAYMDSGKKMEFAALTAELIA